MSYATPDNVKSLFRNFGTSNSTPAVTDAEIQEFLDSAFEQINAKIGTLYSLPIVSGTSPESFKLLARVETYLVAGIMNDILHSSQEADKKPEWEKRAMRILDALVPPRNAKGFQSEPTMKLTDATFLGTQEAKNRIKVNPTSGTTFVKGANNW